ncbi:small subunit processome component 20 homolog isoform X5 [Perca fluviatilis]|uniref:small subunit processome component 20 homolog isoform X5 n=1 Tax=Perca fluviatilis TaxID=8168 RepID=UPI001963EE76|nr:small subunit processome component 20 homolog isoform X5 [Perca fluviatilis]
MVFERICQKELNKLPKNPGSCLAAVEKAVAETDVAAVLPLGRQHSLLNIINVLIQKLGHLIHIYLPKVLQILLCVTASVSTLLDNRFLMQRYIIWTNNCPSSSQDLPKEAVCWTA